MPASQKPRYVGTIGEFLIDGMESVARPRGESPFHHFGIRGCRQVGTSQGLVSADIISRTLHSKPFGGILERREKAVQPAIAVAVIVSPRPAAELLAIISH